MTLSNRFPANVNVGFWLDSAVRRSAAERQLSEENPTFGVQADNIIARARCGRTALAKDLIKSFVVASRASDRLSTDRRLR
jgi:hypothetical protein